MWKDLIIEEVHKYRENYLKIHKFDLHAICEDIRKKQKQDDRPFVPPKPRHTTKKVTKTA